MDLFNNRRDIRESEEIWRLRARENSLQKIVDDYKARYDKLTTEFSILTTILMDIIGRNPDFQRDSIGKHFARYASQDELPTVRDAIQALLRIPRE